MPLIPSYIARFRTHSQSTAASSSSHSGSHSNSTAGPSTPGSELVRLAADPLTEQPEDNGDQTPRTQLARKIHPDLSTLLDEDILSEAVVDDLGPRPSRRLSRSAEELGSTNPDVASQGAEQTQDGLGSESAIAIPRSPRSPLLSRILSVPLLNSVISTPPSEANPEPGSSGRAHWSTFGRRRPLVSSIGEFGSLHRRASGSQSPARSKEEQRRRNQKSAPATPSTTRPPSSAARTNTPSRTQTTETAPSQSNSPAGTVSSSSKSLAGNSHSLRSRRPPLVHPEPIPDTEPATHLDPQTPARVRLQAASFTPSPDIVSPLAARQTLDDSPHTFGRATPKESVPSSKPYPRVGAAFATPSSETPSQHKNPVRRISPATFPQRKRKRSRPTTGSLVSFPSLSRRPAAARGHSEDVFQAGDHRRFSANWSAAEAVRDGGGQQGESWPATVSREMVRLSLIGRKATVGGREAAGVGEEGALAESHVKNATLFGSIGEDRRRFMWAGRRRANTGSAVLTESSSSPPRPSTLQPAFSVSPPSDSGAAPDITTGDRTNRGGLAPHVSVTAPTPSASPRGSRYGTVSDPTPRPRFDDNLPPSQSQGKRKIADSEEEEPSGRLKVSLLNAGKESSNRASDASNAPSSYRRTKRIRLSTPSHSAEHISRPASRSSHASPSGSPRSRPPSSLRTLPNPRTLSQASIPLRAIVSPRPPSVDRRSNYLMRDPALPPPLRQSTQWSGSALKSHEGRRAFPLQGWAFMLGFVLFPVWWAAAVAPVGWGWRARARSVQDGKSARVGDEDLEAREVWEYDVAFTWRRRCRLMSILGLLVYIPLIVLLAVLVPRT